MNFYKYKHIILAPIFLILFLFIALFLLKDQSSRIQIYLDQQSSMAQGQYANVYNSYETIAKSVFILIGNSELVRSAYRNFYQTTDLEQQNQFRQGIFELLNQRYASFRELGLEQLHFHTKDNHSLLRFHKPDWYGDDLSDIRYSVKFVNEYKRFISGFELGRVVHGFRYVFPISDSNGIHLGSVEVSISSDYFLQAIHRSFDAITTSFIVDKSLSEGYLFDNPNSTYYISHENENYLSAKSTKHDDKELVIKKSFISGIKNEVNNNIAKKELFSIYNKVDNKSIVATFIPIRDLKSNRVVAYLVSYKYSPYLDELNSDFLKIFILIPIVMILFYILIIKLIKLLNKITQQKDDEIEQEKILRQRDNLLYQQSKMASLGEMISNIAHQWRQPLSAISTAASGLKLQSELGVLEQKDVIKTSDNIVNYTLYLSKIIDEFRNFVKQDTVKIDTNLKTILDKSLLLIDSKLKNLPIMVINQNTLDTKLCTYENEIIQSIIKILQNAIEVLLKDEHEDDKIIIISTFLEKDTINISIQDSGHGIQEENMDKIFDPYFTTKHQAQGVGLGLYVAYQIITNQLKGNIQVSNKNFSLNNKEYFGAEFLITLPILDK